MKEQIINSLKNKNIKKYIIISFFTFIILNAVMLFIILFTYNYNINNIIKNYNIEQLNENLALIDINKQLYNSIYLLIGINVIIYILIVIYFLYSLSEYEKEIQKIREYVEQVSNGEYQTDIKTFSESEISNLRNDLHKIFIEIREKSEMLSKDRNILSNYLADISHQLRTPLMAISAMLDAIIENENNLDDYTKRFIYGISKQINQINWLTDDLLKMAQLDTKTIIFVREETNIKELLQIVKENVEIFLEQKNIVLDIKSKKIINIVIDKMWIIEAFENIIKNCIEHSDDNTTIEIICTENPLYIEISIADNGEGIDEKDLPHIFERFYKGRKSNKGFGIGLSLAKSIIESQNGEIAVKNNEFSSGSIFTIKLYKEVNI